MHGRFGYNAIMLYITFYTVGDIARGPFEEIRDKLLKQLSPYVKLEHRIIEDAETIAERIKPAESLIVLDASGLSVSTEKLARYVKEVESRGEHIAILIGGPKGISAKTKAKARVLLSLSPMTTTHDIAHIFFLEQLYRVCTINAGKEYHY